MPTLIYAARMISSISPTPATCRSILPNNGQLMHGM
jgi:hypothetical protein